MAQYGSQTAGTKPMSIEGRYGRVRERLIGMTEAERAFRKQWLQDQQLAPSEPRHVPEMYRATHNPIRRFYRFPLDVLGRALAPVLGAEGAQTARYLAGKAGLFLAGAYLLTYYLKYNSSDWTRAGGLKVYRSRTSTVEGEPGYPVVSDRVEPADYASRGFKDCKLNL